MARSLRRSSRLYCLTIFAVLGSVILLAQHPSINKNLPPHLSSLSQLQWSSPTPKTERDRANDLLNTHTLAIWDNNQFHEEVHGSVLWTFSQFENLTVKFYRPKWRWHFDLVVQSFWPDEPTPKEEFFTDLEKDSTIRWVFLPTIDFQKKDFEGISEQLQTIWTNRKPSERFTIVGLRHWGNYDLTKVEMWWAQRDALSLLTLGDHVTDYLIEGQRKNAMKWKNEEEQEAIKRIRVATFVPAFPPDVTDVDDFGKSGPGGSGVEGLNKALIQSGHFDEGHRAMTPLFEEIKNDLVVNPGVWGYKLDAETNDYIPIDPNDPTRFTLKILGLSKTEWPKELNNMVNMESYLPYQPYYDRIHDADIILPAFGTTPYGQSRASSTMGVAATARTPLTVTEDVNQAYGWFCPALARTRDNNMTEVEFIRQVRMGNIPWESKTTVQDDFIKCQYDWTSHNMLTVAELFTLPPEGSNVRDVYFGSDAEWSPAPKEGLVIDEKTLR